MKDVGLKDLTPRVRVGVFKTLLFSLIFSASGCGISSNHVSPPFTQQFQQMEGGKVVDLVVDIKKHDVYNFYVSFGVDGSNQKQRDSLRDKLAGNDKKNLPRIPTPFTLKISRIEKGKEIEFYYKEVDPELTSWNTNTFAKKIGHCDLPPGTYRFMLFSQNKVSELLTERVSLWVWNSPKETFNTKNINRSLSCPP